jgi:ATP-dependent RNA helicase RhlE
MNFENLGLHPKIMSGVRDLGYTELTPIQIKAIPPAMEGKDIIGLAQTGTGKTAAYVIPIIQRLMNSPKKQVGAVIVTPTRELAEQINENVNLLSRHTGIRSAAIYGGTNINHQIDELARGAEVLVACPGRLLDHLWRGSINLSKLEILVLDEADRMLDMGFLPDIKKIITCILQPHQTLMFSATMPVHITKLAREILHNPVTVKIGQTAPVDSVSHSLYPVKQHLKTRLLIELLYRIESKSVLVFTRTKHRTDNIARQLKQAGFSVAALQGDLSQSQRQTAIDNFRSGKVKILIATDIAARGLDILQISHVINYDMPENTDAYIHRIGRTGRVNNSGDALTFVTSADSAMVDSLEQILKKKIERRKLDDFDYTVPVPAKPEAGNNRRRFPVKGRRNRVAAAV